MKRIIVKNKFYDRIESQLKRYDLPYELMEEDYFISNFPQMKDAVILGYGYELYQRIRALHNEGEIHIGLRKFNYNNFSQIPIVFISDNRLVFSKFPVKGEWEDFPDGTGEFIDPSVLFFFSENVLKEPLHLPEVRIVGLREGLALLDIFDSEEYKNSDLGLDFESNGHLPEEVEFNILGFAIASTKPLTAIYFDYRLDYNYDPNNFNQDVADDMQKFNERFHKFVKDNYSRIWTYNCKFEICTLFWMFREFIELQDAYALTICDDSKSSLKFHVQKYLSSPSWDDELDAEHEIIYELGERYANYNEMLAEYQGYLKTQDSIKDFVVDESREDEDYLKLLDVYNSFEEDTSFEYLKNKDSMFRMISLYWADAWSAGDPNSTGVYCGYDSTYTVYLKEKLYDQYQYAYPIYHKNQLLGAEINLTGIEVDVEARVEFNDFCTRLQNNIYTYFNWIYYNQFIKTYEPIFNDLEFSEVLVRLLKLDSNLFEPDPTYFGKTFLRHFVDEDIADTEGVANLQGIADFFGVDILDEISWINDYVSDGYASFFRKRSCFAEFGKFIFDNVINIPKIYADINKKAYSQIEDEINKINSEFEKLWPYNIDIRFAKELLISFIDYRWEYEDSRNYLLKDRELELTENDFNSVLTLPDEVKERLRSYIDLTDESLYLTEINNVVDASILARYPNLPKPATFARLTYYKVELEKYSKCVGKNILEDDLDDDGSLANSLFNYNSNIDFPNWWSVLWNGLKPSAMCLEFFADWFSNHPDQLMSDWRDSHAKEVSEWEEDELDVIFLTKQSLYNEFKSMFLQQYNSDNVQNSEIAFRLKTMEATANELFNFKWYYIPFECMRNLVTTDFTFDYNSSDWDIKRIQSLIALAGVCRKEISTYLRALIEVPKPVYYEDTHYCQKDYDVDWTVENKETNLYVPNFAINMKDTKRWSSGFHTFRQYDDIMMCLKAPEGFINTYFDISQAEPRTLAYISEDPIFMELYESGKDAYMELAKITWPDESPEDLKDWYRPIAKVALLAKTYGRSNRSLADENDLDEDTIKLIEDSLFGRWTKVKELRDHKIAHLETTGYIETLLGDKLEGDPDRAYTTAVNYWNQGSTAVILVDGFYTSFHKIRESGIEVLCGSVVHDSNTNSIPVVDIFEADLIYRRWFRGYLREKFHIDYKYDLDISRNFRDKLKYKFDPDTRICSIKGYSEDVEYILHYLQPRDIKIISDSSEPVTGNRLDSFFESYFRKSHLFCTSPRFVRTSKRAVTFEVRGEIKGIDTWREPTGVEYYFNNVKKWYENPDFDLDLRRNK